MSEQNYCDKDDKQGCCGSTDGKCFNWQKAIFIVVVIAALGVAAHSYLANGAGTCPITGACAEAGAVDTFGADAACTLESGCEKKAVCDGQTACDNCPKDGGSCDKQAVCDKAATCDKKAVCEKAEAGAAVCPMSGSADNAASESCPSMQSSTEAAGSCPMSGAAAEVK